MFNTSSQEGLLLWPKICRVFTPESQLGRNPQISPWQTKVLFFEKKWYGWCLRVGNISKHLQHPSTMFKHLLVFWRQNLFLKGSCIETWLKPCGMISQQWMADGQPARVSFSCMETRFLCSRQLGNKKKHLLRVNKSKCWWFLGLQTLPHSIGK